MNRKFAKFIEYLAPFLFFVVGNVQAQDERAMARAQQMLRQLSTEKSQLQQELTQLRQEYANYRADTERSLAALESKQKNLAESIASLDRDGKQLDRQLDVAQQSLLREQAAVGQLQNQLQLQTGNLEACKLSNDALADTAYELIGLYKDKGFMDVLSNREPATGLAKVKVETIVQTFEDRVMENLLELNPQLLREPELLRDLEIQKPGRQVAGERSEE